MKKLAPVPVASPPGNWFSVLDEASDAGRIEALGEAVIECRTQAEFLARAHEA